MINSKELKDKLVRSAKVAGSRVVYPVLLLYFAYQKKEVPRWAKMSILGSIAYFLSPFDIIPDLTPILGFSDDLGVLLASLVTVGVYIDDQVRGQAREKMKKWFSDTEVNAAAEWVDKDLKSRMP